MNVSEIQKKCDELAKAMLGKGLRSPEARLHVESNVEPYFMIKWSDPTKDKTSYGVDSEYKWFRGSSLESLFAEAKLFIEELPSAEETRFKQFMTALGGVIDLGKENGIDVDFINPLQATMKRLSENVITDQRKDKTVNE